MLFMLTHPDEEPEMDGFIARGTHYSSGQNPASSLVFASAAVEILHKQFAGVEASMALVYSGMSGISLATTINILYYQKYGVELHMIYVRKGDEKSHGRRLEMNYSQYNHTIITHVIVDDFVEYGNTVKYIMNEVKMAVETRNALYGEQHEGTDWRMILEYCTWNADKRSALPGWSPKNIWRMG